MAPAIRQKGAASELRDFARSSELLSSDRNLAREYPRKWIAVYGGEVRAVADELDALLDDLGQTRRASIEYRGALHGEGAEAADSVPVQPGRVGSTSLPSQRSLRARTPAYLGGRSAARSGTVKARTHLEARGDQLGTMCTLIERVDLSAAVSKALFASPMANRWVTSERARSA